MASGTISSGLYGSHVRLRIEWSSTENITTNASTVNAKIYLVHKKFNMSARSSGLRVTVNGTQKTFSTSAISYTGSSETKTLLASTSVTVPHDNDGKKTAGMSAEFDFKASLSGTYHAKVSCSGSVVLNTIARASTITVGGTVEPGQSVTLSIAPKAAGFSHAVTYGIGSFKSSANLAAGVKSHSFAPPESWLNAIPNSASGKVSVSVQTKNGSANVGSAATGSFTLSVPANKLPTITAVKETRIDGDVPAAWGCYVQSKSKVTFELTAVGSMSSTITGYQLSGAGFSSGSAKLATGVLQKAGTQTFNFVVTDSRARKAVTERSIVVEEYQNPFFNTASVVRCDASGAQQDEGSFARLNCSFTYNSVGARNICTATVQLRRMGGTFGEEQRFSSGQTLILSGVSPDHSYEVLVRLRDVFCTVEQTLFLNSARVTMDFKKGGRGVGIGKVAEAEGLDIDMDTRFRRTVVGEAEAIFSNTLQVGRTLDDDTRRNLSMAVDAAGLPAIEFWDADKSTKMWSMALQNGLIPLSNGGTGSGNIHTARANLGMGETLFQGSWGSGTLTVPGIRNYSIFMVVLEGWATGVLTVLYNNCFRGVGLTQDPAGTQNIMGVTAKLNTNTLTYEASGRTIHAMSGNHSYFGKMPVVLIRGLI